MTARVLPARSRRSALDLAALLAALLGAVGVHGIALAQQPVLRFSDQSAISAGPIDLGAPTSDVEKSGAAWTDADGDGFDDLVFLTGVGQALGYFLNRPSAQGRTLIAAAPGHGLDTGTVLANDGACLTVGDVDGDGDEDLYVGAGFNRRLDSGENALLLNDGTGAFTDVTVEAGLEDGDNTTAACVLFDMDNDGDLDLLSANTDFGETSKEGDGVTHLFRNRLAETGTLTFVDETEARGVVELGRAVWQASAFDYDLDGDADLLITHDIAGLTQLFANDGSGFFTDVTADVGAGPGSDGDPSTFGDDSLSAMGVAVGDVENDGDLDVFISNIRYNPLYLSNGDGTFREAADERGCSQSLVSWGPVFADFDLDGFIDLHVASGDVWNHDRPEVRSYLFHNRGDGFFDEVFTESGMRHDPPLHREVGTAAADYDSDGRVDLLVTRSHRFVGASPYLYRNETDTGARRWIALRLRGDGAATNTSAIGATLRVVPRGADGSALAGLTQLRHVTASDSRGGRSSLWQHVGLGAEAETVDVEVFWPRAGSTDARKERFVNLPTGVRVEVLEQTAAPVIAAAVERRRGRKLALRGRNFAPGRVTVSFDGEAATKVVVRPHRREADGDGTRLIAKLPKSKRGAATLVVDAFDPVAALRSTPYRYSRPTEEDRGRDSD